MARKITVDFELKYKEASKNLDEFQKEYTKLEDQVQKQNKETADSIKGIEKASNNASNGIKKIGTTLKAIGIGLLLAAFAKLKEVFEENQKVADFFNTTFEALSLAFNDFFNFIDKNAGGIVDWFKGIFENPVQSIKDFGKAITENITERFNSLLDTLGYLGKAFKKLFEGDFAGAWEEVKNAGKESIDIITGVDNTFDKTADTIANYVTETVKAAKSIVQLNKQAELARVLNQGLIEDYDRQAEKLRQVRDDETKTIAERIEANDKLAKVLEEQKALMLENADSILLAAQAQYDKNQNDANAIALQEAKNEKKAIEAQIENFISEQKTNSNALDREAIELTNSQIEAENNRLIESQKANAELIGNEVARLQKLKEIAEEERRIEIKRLEEKRDSYTQNTQDWQDADNELEDFKQQSADAEIARERALAEAKLATISGALGGVAKLVGENSKFGKAIAISQAIMDTYAGANKALAQGGLFGAIGAAGIIASGLANVKKIASTQEPSAPSFASGATTGATPSIPTPPDFNVVGASGANQLADAVAGQLNKPVKAYVVSKDVSTAQEMDRNVVDGASLG